MIKYTKNLWKKFIESSVKSKIIISLILVLYIGIILICTISFKYEYTSPGTLNGVNTVISIENTEATSNFYTVSVYNDTKSCSLLEYWLRSLDPKQDIRTKEERDSSTIFTVNEETKAGEAQKEQSIQDAIIVAYEMAKEDGYDVELIKEYKGVMVCYMPMNSIGSGPESIQSKDIITKIGDTEIDSIETLVGIVGDIYNNKTYKQEGYKSPIIEVLRKGTGDAYDKLTLDTCNALSLAYLGLWYKTSQDYAVNNNLNSYKDYLTNFMFDYYTIDTVSSKPKLTIDKASSVGPSGGLCQTLYIYNALTNNSLTKNNKFITATGTIALDGTVGAIGEADKKVYTVDIYGASYFFVPSINYEKAMSAYNKIKNPNFKVIKVDNARDAVKYLKEAGE